MASESPAPTLLSPFKHEATGVTFRNRVALAPLTRGRSGASRIPNEANLKYYTQRASAGLVITEGTTFNDSSNGWVDNAAIWTDEQVAGWKKVVDAVHEKGSLMSLQIWHMGRASYENFHENNALPIAPSAIPAVFEGRDANNVKLHYPTPRAIETEEIPGLVADFAKAAANGKNAGFDFIEIHCANGYLLDEFLQSKSNKRTDAYGGSFENRFRLVKEIIEACSEVFPKNRIGVRFGPNGSYNDMGSPDNVEAFTYFATQINKMNIGYIHVMDGLAFGYHNVCRPMTLVDFRKVYDGLLIGNCGYTRDTAEGTIKAGAADLIAFGRPFIANPDLVERFMHDWKLNPGNPQTWFTHDPEGYSDYKTYEEETKN